MSTINLKDFYYWCNEDTFVDVSDEMLEAMKSADRQQEAYRRRMYRYKAQYSLDCHDGIENDVLIGSHPRRKSTYIKRTWNSFALHSIHCPK